MTNKIIGRFVVVLAVLAQGCASTTRVTPVTNVIKAGRGGVVYALPETVLDIVVPIDRVTETAPRPPFSEWTERLFGEKIRINNDRSTYGIGLPSFTVSGQPDRSKVFYAQISGGPFSDSSMTMKFDARGILTSATVESENKTLEFVVSTFEAGAKIGGSVAKFISATEQKSGDEKPPPPVLEAYQRIKDAIATKANILVGPGGDVAVRLAEINDAIKKDMALFFGSKTKETWSGQFRVVPQGSAAAISLFRYSPGGGIAKFDIKPRNRIGDGFDERGPGERTVYVVFSQVTPLVEQQVASQRLFTQQKRGLHYNIPAAATVTIYDDAIRASRVAGPGTKPIKLLSSIQSFAQFGSVGFLPVSTGSHKLHQDVTLDGATGALLAVTNSSNAFDPNNVNKIGNASAGLIDTLDPKVRAERQRDIAKADYEKLDLEKKTRDLEAEMQKESDESATP